MKRVVLGSIIGFGLVYFLDPTNGSKRRGKVTGLVGGSSDQPEPYRPQPIPPTPVQGTTPEPAASVPTPPASPRAEASPTPQRSPKQDHSSAAQDNTNPDDNTLRDRVESELFSNTEYGREHLNISVVDGVVEVRGELPGQQEIDTVVQQISAVRNVKGVHSYLHLPGTSAPNKESVLETS